MKKIYTIIVFISFSLLGFSQNNYYVSPTGNDSNDGTITFPWQSIQYGFDQIIAGDTLNILEGVYQQKLFLEVSGTADQMITIRAFQGQNVVIDAFSFSDNEPIFYAESISNIRVEGLHFTNNFNVDGAGFFVQGWGSNWEVINCKFSNIAISTDPDFPVSEATNMPVVLFTGTGASDSLYNILIQGNEVFNCRPGYSECISLGGNLSGFSINNNHVHDNTNIGILAGGNYIESPSPSLDHARYGLIKNNHCHHNISPYSPAAGIYIDGGENVLIENNTCHHNGYGGEIGCEETGNCSFIIFKNNVFYYNTSAGMHIGGYDVSTGGFVEFSQVLNNTFYHNDSNEEGNGEIIFTQFENGIVNNNIFYISSQNYFISNDRAQPNLAMDYNLVYCEAGQDYIEAYWNDNDLSGLDNIYNTINIGEHDTYGNPLFSNPTNYDFHIPSASPALNQGDPNYSSGYSEVDMDGEARINNNRIDCGADEHYPYTEIADVLPPIIGYYPNPTNDVIYLLGDEIEGNYQLVSISGTVIIEGILCSNKIDISTLENGMYFLLLNDYINDQTYSLKIIKE